MTKLREVNTLKGLKMIEKMLSGRSVSEKYAKMAIASCSFFKISFWVTTYKTSIYIALNIEAYYQKFNINCILLILIIILCSKTSASACIAIPQVAV